MTNKLSHPIVTNSAMLAALWLLSLFFAQTTASRRLELFGFDALSVLTAPASAGLPIVIVGIDEPSFAEIDQPWPWPRRIHAELIDKLSAAGAAVIAFDVVFAEPSDSEQDTRLAEAINKASNVVLASDIVRQNSGQFEMAMPVEPLPVLRQAGARTGLASINLDPDMVVRAIPSSPDAMWRRIVEAYLARSPAARPGVERAAGSHARFFGPDHVFRYVSYYQALDPDNFLPVGIFKGKIVLIGHDSKVSLGRGETLGNEFATPFSGRSRTLTPGVEVHATLVASALSGAALTEVSRLWSSALTALALVLLALAGREWQAGRAGLIALGIVAVIVGLSFWLFAVMHLWLPAISAMLAVGVMYVAQVGIAFVRERHQRRQVQIAFRHYVAPEIVREMTAHPERLVLGGARRDITLLFTDLAGFTSVSETMSPEQVSALLNDYLTHMTRIVLKHAGTVDKFIGDSIMAFWGAPLPDSQQAVRACKAAVEMQAELGRLRQTYQSKSLPELHMRIGVHSGPAVVGNMGSADRFDYTAIGDNVNLASRLEGTNKLYGTEILISKDTARQLGDAMSLRLVDRVIVKGKTQPIDIYTFCENRQTIRLGEEARILYLQQRWDEAADKWQTLIAQDANDKIAKLFLRRIAEFRLAPPPDGWDGSVALDKM